MRIFRRNRQRDDELLQRLIRDDIRRKREEKSRNRKIRFLGLFSHGSWQAIGAIIGLLSLIASVLITFYVLQLTRERETANFETSYEITGAPDSNITYAHFRIINSGPSTGEAVQVIINSNGFVD